MKSDAWRRAAGGRAREISLTYLPVSHKLKRKSRVSGRSEGCSDVRQARYDTYEARQGEKSGVVRWVLGISLPLAIVAMIVAYLVF